MKYFFLAEGWSIGRIWGFGGLWDETAWRRSPQIDRLNLKIVEQGQELRLYQVEEAVLMVEVMPSKELEQIQVDQTIGQVVLKRLITAEQVVAHLQEVERINLDH